MKYPKFLLSVCLLCFCFVTKADAQRLAQENWVQNLGNQLVNVLQIYDREVRFNALRAIMENNINQQYIAKQVIGRRWNSMDINMQERFINVLKNYFIYSYAGNPRNMENTSFQVLGSEPMPSNPQLLKVFANLSLKQNLNNQAPVNITILLESQPASYKILDVEVAGMSMILFIKRIFTGKMQENQNNIYATLHNLELDTENGVQGQGYSNYPQFPNLYGN